MATHRGFVQSIQIDRAAVATIVVVHVDASIGTYIIQDLDGDPERFNERLSKLAVLRDAMNRAEPVEIVSDTIEQGEEILTATRLTRDAIQPLGALTQLSGTVIGLVVLAQNGADASGDIHCTATVTLLAQDLSTATAVLDLQAPERGVADQQLAMLRDAEANASSVTLVVTPGPSGASNIVSIALGSDADVSGQGGKTADFSGFVETLGLIKDFPTEPASFAHVRFTTAPEFSGLGNTVSTAPFTPATLDLLVSRNSEAYELFETALRDKLRMRVEAASFNPRNQDATDSSKAPTVLYVVLGAELVAPLASASRPVWISVSRRGLDVGPEEECADGVPTSDLGVRTLRDLRIPYAAKWQGFGCFNHGVYRFQFQLESPFRIEVDDRRLCLHDSDQPAIKFAYACLGGDHRVEIVLEEWTCDQTFEFDVYRLR